ncbi:hypothetical protein [Salimicrobium album]|uniref:Uncharacterized protein n=1 Tax=Salimicrobium album TaxID=50717 RepID=A0A1H3DDG6_9BACI|nr:hypothetical protein [Salimicrobium album]SDX64397.1 hypothetical protein SAMN04488081_0922 [Salimicrobium album]
MRLIDGQKQEIGSTIDQLRNAVPMQLEIYKEVAKLHKGYFDSLVEEGFTEEQALHIVTVQGINANGQPTE